MCKNSIHTSFFVRISMNNLILIFTINFILLSSSGYSKDHIQDPMIIDNQEDSEVDYTFLHYCEDCSNTYREDSRCTQEINTTILAMKKSVKKTFHHSLPDCDEAYEELKLKKIYYDDGAGREYRIASLKPFKRLSNLRYLYIFADDSLTDISPLSNLKNLRSIIIHDAKNLVDISPLNQLPKLHTIDITNGGIKDLSVLTPLVNQLKAVSFFGNPLLDPNQLSQFLGVPFQTLAYRNGRSCENLYEFHKKHHK